jgi:S-ribosylhomocysteine lyase LuxS involved in autoinducer biosynthesis
MERNVIEESLDDYIAGRLKKYNLKKYPANYDQLCGNYQKEKQEQRKTEERKILALQNELKIQQNDRRQ